MNTRRAMFTAPLLLAACLAAALSSSMVLAMGGDDAPAKPQCPKGKVLDTRSNKCVSQQSSLAPDADRTDYAYRLAKDGRYEEALALLDTLKQPDTAKALN
jgi:hypothetical protein